ncbi:hypothetical protein AAEP80_18200 [Curtobacterium sp. L3-7]|uniref:hypothetical protein n=1 Tax=Curtobacterium sp. L3-7 TaxID=3138787 RepID=UPI003B51F833
MGERLSAFDDPGDDLALRPARAQRKPGAVDLTVTIAALAVSYLAAPAAWFAVVISQMAFDACAMPSPGCDYRAGSAVLVWHPTVTVLVLVLGTCWAVARRVRGRATSLVGLGTLAGVVVTFLAAEVVTHTASAGHLF